MSFPWILLITISFCSASTTMQNSEKLYVVKNFSNKNDPSIELTCMSEDDDAALSWNYDLITMNECSDSFKRFESTTWTTRNSPECAIWESNRCSVSWKERNDWTIVNSLIKPMGPVVDYRWEDFEEFVLNTVTGQKEYQNVLLLDSLDGNLLFSVRGARDVEINLCDDEDPTTSSCFLINIAVEGTHSVIENCVSDESSYEQHNVNRSCEKVNDFTHETAVLDSFEWRTFRLQWSSNDKVIKLFRDNEEQAFLEGHVQQWHDVHAVAIISEIAARVKFHFYGYLLATRENALLTTAEFNQRDENFCANMLVSLCIKCQLNVSLMDSENGSRIAYTVISGDEHPHSSGWHTWRSVKLNMTLGGSFPTLVKLQIISVVNEDNDEEFLWAIDNLRVCKQDAGVRESTVMISTLDLINDEPSIKCQKLLDNRILVADLTTSKPSNDISQLRQFIRERTKLCPPGCKIFPDVNDNPTDCKCVQEFSESYEDACLDIVPGKRTVSLVRGFNSSMCRDYRESYHVQLWEEPGHKKLKKQVCPTLECTYSFQLKPSTEYNVRVMCAYGIVMFEKNVTTLESGPGKVRDLTFKSVFAANVTGEWAPPIETDGGIRNYTVIIQRTKLFGCEDFSRISPPEPESSKTVTETTASFSGLHPYAEYNFTVIANAVEPGPPVSKIFKTDQLNISTSNVSSLHIVEDSFIFWNHPEDCTTVTGPAKMTRLVFSGISDWAKNWTSSNQTMLAYYDLNNEKLLSNTQYKLCAYVIRDYDMPINQSNCQELFWTTAPAAPPAVQDLTIYEVNTTENTISARWEPPYPANGEIESYQLLLLNENSIMENRSIDVSELQNCMLSYMCIENLSIPSNISTNTDLEIFARNMNVSMDGAKTSKWFKLDDLYSSEA